MHERLDQRRKQWNDEVRTDDYMSQNSGSKHILFTLNWSIQRITRFYENALYKSTTYLLTYLLTYLIN